MRKSIFIFMMITGSICHAQVKIGDNPTSISPGSLLELESTSKALTLPRMTTIEMEAIPSPLSGMIVFNIDSNCLYLYKSNNAWTSINPGTPTSNWPYHSNDKVVGQDGNGKGIISATGVGLVASGNYSHAEGMNSLAAGNYSWSSGYADTADNTASIALGYENKSIGNYSFSTGYRNIAAHQASIALGQNNSDSGWASMAVGLQNQIQSGVSYSNVIGYLNTIRGGWSNICLGESNIINSGRANSNMGYGNIANGSFNTLLGKSNQVLAGSSNIVGGTENIMGSGDGNILLGGKNTANGNYLTALGFNNIVSYHSAVALGSGNRDSGFASVTGGLNNVIDRSAQYSVSFGYNNYSTKNTSLLNTTPGAGTFSAGINNYNSGFGSIALGTLNRSTSVFSLAANYNTMSNSYGMSSFGHYNDTIQAYPGESYAGGEMLFSIGNGVSNSARRNSMTMLRNGFTTINTTSATGPNTPRAELDIKGTGAIIVPVGTTAQRPATPVTGMIRFCTDCPGGPVLQGFNGTAWVDL